MDIKLSGMPVFLRFFIKLEMLTLRYYNFLIEFIRGENVGKMNRKLKQITARVLLSIMVFQLVFSSHGVEVLAEEYLDLVNQVEKYTSEFDQQQITEKISKGDYEGAKQLIQTVKDGYRERWNYYGLLKNDIYIAYQFKEYMTGDFFSKGWWASVTTWFSGLFYNDELKDYLSMGSPGKEKYKDMLKQYISSTSEELVSIEYANLLIEALNSADELRDTLDRDTYDILFEMFSEAGNPEEINKAMIQFIDSNSEFFANKSELYLFKNQLSKTLNILGTGAEYLNTTINAMMDIQFICANKKALIYYEDFLNNIASIKYENGDYMAPKDLRIAARELQEEMQGNFSSITEKMINEISVTTVESGMEILSIKNIGILNQILLGIDIGTLVGNAVFDMGSLVKGVSYVQGYAYAGEIYSIILQEDKEKFLSNRTIENAKQFEKDYNILYTLRLNGETAYLEMSDFSGSWDSEDQKMLQSWTDYTMKKSFCDNNIKMVESFEFIIPEIENGVNDSPYLYGEWEVNTDYTNGHNTKSTFDMFGTGYSYGSGLSLNEDNTFSFWVGIGFYGTGTYEIDNNTIKVHIDDYMEFQPDIGYDFTINIIEDNGSVLLELEFDQNFNLYWKKNTLPKEVRDIRDYCNLINNEIFIFEKEEENLYTRYFDNGKCIKIELQPSESEFRDYYIDFYYENEKPVYISISNGMRFYYKDDMLIRWIDEKENVHDYNSGITPDSLDMVDNYYLMAQMEIAYIYGN